MSYLKLEVLGIVFLIQMIIHFTGNWCFQFNLLTCANLCEVIYSLPYFINWNDNLQASTI